MDYFDIHTHILPHTDDGSSSSAESIEMLLALYAQGVTRVALTPHFKAVDDDPDRFFKRARANTARLLERLKAVSLEDEAIKNNLPDIYLGAEVAFFNAMSNVSAISDMCLSGTKYLLVEMPFDKWTVAMVDELGDLSKNYGITPIIAHIDRYFPCFSEAMLDDMIQRGFKIQINADAFLGFWTRRRALALMEAGKVHFIGSDAHNMGKRAPRLGEAVIEIEKRIGRKSLDAIIKNGEELAAEATPIFKVERDD